MPSVFWPTPVEQFEEAKRYLALEHRHFSALVSASICTMCSGGPVRFVGLGEEESKEEVTFNSPVIGRG